MSRAKKVSSKGASSSRSAPQLEDSILTASVVTERNLDLSPSTQSAGLILVQHLLRDRQLLPLASVYRKYNETIVREFYAAFPRVEHFEDQSAPIKVRGKNVVLSPSLICDILNLPEGDTDAWNHYVACDFKLQDAAEGLFYANPTAFASQRKKTVLIQGRLTPYFAILWSFVRHNIYPSGQRSEITTLGVKIMNILHEGTFSLPVEDIIFHRLMACARKKNIIYFPCLVSMICEHFGVRARASDVFAEPMSPISDTSVSKSVSQRRDAPPPRPHMSSSSVPFPPAPDVDTSSWDPSLQAIWDMQMLQYQQMQRISSSIDAMWTHLQMPGQPESAPRKDNDDEDDEDDEE